LILKQEALDRTVWRAQFRTVCGSVATETAQWRGYLGGGV